MNHLGKKGRNHESLRSNDSASTPDPDVVSQAFQHWHDAVHEEIHVPHWQTK